ncbi:phage tail tape measure protein [Roseiconus lacunae]|uniref:phage tail tape measure protein n=1 Tax=Roseiconus lacunae TaxID=2605694 RepID=UPI00308EE045|nr:phage tail tape measure protein [Stieleria sp. HD01]
MNKRQIKAGGAYVEIGIRNRIAQGARQVEADLKNLGRRVGSFGAGAIGASSAILGPLAAATQGFASMGTEVAQLSERTGVGVRALSELKYAAEQSGVDFGDLGGAMEELNIRLGEAVIDQSGAAADALKKLGLDANALADMPLPERLEVLADAISGISNNAKKQFLADEIFGGDAFKVMGLLNQGADGIKGLRQEAESLGLSMGNEQAKSAQQFTKSMNRLWSLLKGVTFTIGGALAPVLTDLVDLISAGTKGFLGFVKENQTVIQVVAGVAAGIGIAGGALVGIGAALTLAGIAVGGLATVFGALLSPIGLGIIAVGGLGAAILTYTDLGGAAIQWLKDEFGPLVDSAREAVEGIKAAIQTGDLEKAWQIVTELMQLVWAKMTDKFQDAWDSMVLAVLDTGAGLVEKIGGAIEGLAAALDKLLSKYRSVYDTIYDATLDTIIGGEVKTVGDRGSAFDANFGGLASGFGDLTAGMREYGKALRESSGKASDDYRESSADANAERERKIAERQGQLSKSSNEAQQERDKQKKKDAGKGKDKEPNGLKKLMELAERLAKGEGLDGGLSGDGKGNPDEEEKKSFGSFSAFAAGLVGGTDQAADRTATATERSANYLQQLAERDAALAAQAGVDQAMKDHREIREGGAMPRHGSSTNAPELAMIAANTAATNSLLKRGLVARFST